MRVANTTQAIPPARTDAAAPRAAAAQAAPSAAARTTPGATSDGSAEVTVERTARAAPAAVASPKDVVTQFYAAFEKGDTATLARLYHPAVKFQDAMFSYEDRAGTMKMWTKILADPSTKIRFTMDSVDGKQVTGHWVADYKILGRPVHNEIKTTMTVENGLITSHKDDFSWNKWAPQALPLGHLATLPGIKQLVQMVIRSRIDN